MDMNHKDYGLVVGGNPRNLHKHHGKWDEPIFMKGTDPSGQIQYTDKVAKTITRYEKPFSQAAVDEILKRNTAPRHSGDTPIGYTLDLGYIKYTVPSYKDIVLPIDQLIRKVVPPEHRPY
jgi:hypothetical protein